MQQITKLTPAADFGQTLTEYSDSDYRRIRNNYDAMFKSPLELWMFVPIDEEGEIVTEPKEADFTDNTGFVNNAFFIEMNDYQAAKSRCLFEGAYFELFPNSTVNGAIWLADTQIVNTDVNYSRQYWHFETIEQLANECESDLTPTALKEIYGS